MSWLSKTERSKITSALAGLASDKSRRKKKIKIILGCTFEYDIDDIGHGEQYLEEVMDKCREYGTAEIVDAKIVYAKDEEC